MELDELIDYRKQLLDEIKDSEGYSSDESFIDYALPALNETKYIDTTDVNDIYSVVEKSSLKVNAYTINESGERLQLLIVNETSLTGVNSITDENVLISQKAVYDKHFTRGIAFVKKSIKKQISDEIQEGCPAWILIHQLQSAEFIDQIDVVEIFLLTATITVEQRGAAPTLKNIEFEDEEIPTQYTMGLETKKKAITIIKRLIDINFLYNVQIAQGSRYPLIIDFSAPPFNQTIPCLKAASETTFDAYLCAIPATLLSELYKRYSSRLLEKNVRSFLQLKGVNKGMQETIKKEPEKFLAYNNGLTITATNSELVEHNGHLHIKSLSDFQIVNGGQTTATLYFSQKAGLKIEQVRVMAKINVAKDANDEILDELISNISTFSNAQSKVSKVDLRARSSQLVKLKALSESILTPSGKKWFFERAKGEYATMVRINSGRKTQIEKTYPQERRFSKEELAKYHQSWGNAPFAVKRGGEKIFRLFLEEISGEGSKRPTNINRTFFEDLIARIILFRSLEKLYGTRNNSLGQIRSAVVPYSLASLYSFTTGGKGKDAFDLLKIWKSEKLEANLQDYFLRLMKLMNVLIKKYSKSDDLGEYSKRPELWNEILESEELFKFMESAENQKIIRQYSISQTELKKRQKMADEVEVIDFEHFRSLGKIFDRGEDFYKQLLGSLYNVLSKGQVYKLNSIIKAIRECQDLDHSYIEFEKDVMNIALSKDASLLNATNNDARFESTIDFIIKKYNYAISNNKDVYAMFEVVKQQAMKRGIKETTVFNQIGSTLASGNLPSILQVKKAAQYCMLLNS